MKKLIVSLSFLLCFINSFSPAHADMSSKEIETCITDLQKTYTQMDTFHADFSQNLFHRESGTLESREGFIVFEKPNNIHWETKKPNPEMLVMNEKEIWNYLPDEEIAYIYNLKMLETSHVALNIITGQEKITDNFEVEPYVESETYLPTKEQEKQHKDMLKKEYIPLLLYPFESTTSMVEALLWVDPKSHLIKEVSILDFYGNLNTITFHDLKANKKVEKGTFTFTPPKGIIIEDHTKE